MRIEGPNRRHEYFQSIIDEAKSSLYILSPTGNGMLHAFASFNLHDGMFSGKELRVILNLPPGKRWEFGYIDPIEFFGLHGWDLRWVERPSLNACLIIDQRTVILTPLVEKNSQYIANYAVSTGLAVNAVINHFTHLWEGHDSVDLLYEDLIDSSAPEIENRILIVSNEQWDSIIAYLSRNPKKLYSMQPRKFEELVAELLVRNGMQVELTPPTKDGGRDILAVSESDAGQHLYYVECKRYSMENPVQVSLVRALYGVIEADKATAGLLVTTSFFTRGAVSFRESVKHRLSLKDYYGLAEWLKRSRH